MFSVSLKALDGLCLNTVDGAPPEILHTRGRGSLNRSDMIAFHSAAAFLPWKAWLFHGDRQILEGHYPLMKAYVDRFARQVEHRMASLQDWGDWGDAYLGDEPVRPATPFVDNTPEGNRKWYDSNRTSKEVWVDLFPFPLNTPIALSAAARFYGALQTTMQCAEILGHAADAAAMRDDVMIKCGGHISGGWFMDGIPAMRSKYGYADEAALLFQTDTYPSWGQILRSWSYNVIPERWPASRHATDTGKRRIQPEKAPAARWVYDSIGGDQALARRSGLQALRAFTEDFSDGGRL